MSDPGLSSQFGLFRFGQKARSSDGGWPEPLDAARYGIAGDLLSAIDGKSEADPAAVLAQFLAAFGNVIGRKHYATVDRSRHYSNLFVVVVGDTAAARKGTSWGVVEHILREIDATWADRVSGGLTSGEGVLARARDAEGDETPTDKRIMIVEEELASVFRNAKREGSNLSQTLRRLWDKGNSSVMRANDPLRVTDAHVSIVGHIVKSELLRELTESDAANGFGNRFMFVGAKQSVWLPDGAGMDLDAEAVIVEKVRKSIAWAREHEAIVMRRDADASALWGKLYKELGDVGDTMVGSITSRAQAQVLRLGVVYALLDCSDVVRVEHLRAALDLWRYCEQTAYLLFGGKSGNSIRDRIVNAIRESGDAGLTRSTINDALSGHVKSHQIHELLTDLEQSGVAYAVKEKTEGRPLTRWYLRRGISGVAESSAE